VIETAIEINPNLRFANGETSVEREDLSVRGPLPRVGTQVAVYERVSRVYGTAVVTTLDEEDITLAVDWDRLKVLGGADEQLRLDLTPDLVLGLLNNSVNVALTLGRSEYITGIFFVRPNFSYAVATTAKPDSGTLGRVRASA